MITVNGSAGGSGRPYETVDLLDAQPLKSFLEIYIGDHKLPDIPPDYLQSFEIERVSEGASKFTLILFDQYWDELESQLHQGWDNISFRYGHVTGRQSRMFQAMVTDYNLEFSAVGASLAVNGTTTGIKQNLQKVTTLLDGETPDAVFISLCEQVGWQVGRVDRALAIKDTSDLYSDVPVSKSWGLVNENPGKYIMREIAPRAIRQSDGKGGYQFYLDDSTKPPTANFHPIDINPNTDRTYIYQRGVNTNVISFAPDFKGVFGAAGSGNATIVRSNVVDPVTKEESVVEYSIDTNPNKDLSGEYTHVPQDLNDMNIDSSGMSKEEVSAMVNYSWTQNFQTSYEATLEIVGDPTLEVTQTIRVVVLTSKNTLHHTSGVYMIKGIKDSIEGGIMKSELQLIRNGDLDEGIEIIRKGILRK